MDITQILHLAKSGDSNARADLIRVAYDDLKRIASGKMADERQNHTLTATALVHEVSLKMLNDSMAPTGSREQFYAYASKAMRNLLIDHARSKGSQKRGGGRAKFSFDEVVVVCEKQPEELLRLSDALDALAEFEPRKAQLVEMRYFGGLSNQEIASALEVSLATVKREWAVARSWLRHELGADSPADGTSCP